MNVDANDREMLRQATAQLTAANAVIKFVSDYLRAKYQLPDGAVVTSDGEIILPSPKNEYAHGQLDLLPMQSEMAMPDSA